MNFFIVGNIIIVETFHAMSLPIIIYFLSQFSNNYLNYMKIGINNQ
jgi:hypothetical protein